VLPVSGSNLLRNKGDSQDRVAWQFCEHWEVSTQIHHHELPETGSGARSYRWLLMILCAAGQ